MQTDPPGPEGSVIAAALAGDARAQAEVLAVMRGFARHIWRGSLPAAAAGIDWEDVGQEAARKLFSAGAASYEARGADRSYLYACVRLTSLELARSASRRRAREETVALDDATHPRPEHGLDAQRILENATEDCRQLLEAVYFRDASTAELAAMLGLQESSVRSKLSRCMRRAREFAEAA